MLEDAHIEFLEFVAKDEVTLWYAPGGRTISYVHRSWTDHQTFDQKVAAQVKALGLTKVIHDPSKGHRSTFRKPTVVVLSEKGERILNDEREAWENEEV